MKKDLDFIARLEKAIKEKYGTEAIENPKKHWTAEKEARHDEQRREFYKRKYFKDTKKSKENYRGFLVSKTLLTRDSVRSCPTCGEYSFDQNDDLYMTKYGCCFGCYIEYVEDREERWESGWRPNTEEQS